LQQNQVLRQTKANGQIRTDNRRFTKPESENANLLNNQALTETGENVLASCLALLSQKDADLALVVEHWPNLPEHIKAAVKTLVNSFLQGTGR
jgi:hypothetical protein